MQRSTSLPIKTCSPLCLRPRGKTCKDEDTRSEEPGWVKAVQDVMATPDGQVQSIGAGMMVEEPEWRHTRGKRGHRERGREIQTVLPGLHCFLLQTGTHMMECYSSILEEKTLATFSLRCTSLLNSGNSCAWRRIKSCESDLAQPKQGGGAGLYCLLM